MLLLTNANGDKVTGNPRMTIFSGTLLTSNVAASFSSGFSILNLWNTELRAKVLSFTTPCISGLVTVNSIS